MSDIARFRPELIHPSVYLAEGARIAGDVTIGEDSSVWFNAVLRSDLRGHPHRPPHEYSRQRRDPRRPGHFLHHRRGGHGGPPGDRPWRRDWRQRSHWYALGGHEPGEGRRQFDHRCRRRRDRRGRDPPGSLVMGLPGKVKHRSPSLRSKRIVLPRNITCITCASIRPRGAANAACTAVDQTSRDAQVWLPRHLTLNSLPRPMTSFVTHLESAIDGTQLPASEPQTLYKDRPLWVRYDLDAVRQTVRPEDFAERPPVMWRYRELLPPADERSIVSLGEQMTPILRCRRLGHRFGLDHLYIKDESRLPTGSFKSRGLAMAISMAGQFGLRRVAIPTAGNAGGAMAAYAARAGMEAFVFMPADTPVINQLECRLAGASTFLVNGLINDCGRIVREGKEHLGWFDLSTLKEPYRIEGKKTMGLELAEQFGWVLPDVIVYPTGGGTGLIGMWKAFDELAELGWLAANTARAWWPCNRRAVRRSCGHLILALALPSRLRTPKRLPPGSACPWRWAIS